MKWKVKSSNVNYYDTLAFNSDMPNCKAMSCLTLVESLCLAKTCAHNAINTLTFMHFF